MTLLKEPDFGTPAKASETLVTLEVDGVPVTVPEGTSVMRAAAEVGPQRAQAVRHRQPRGVWLLPTLRG